MKNLRKRKRAGTGGNAKLVYFTRPILLLQNCVVFFFFFFIFQNRRCNFCLGKSRILPMPTLCPLQKNLERYSHMIPLWYPILSVLRPEVMGAVEVSNLSYCIGCTSQILTFSKDYPAILAPLGIRPCPVHLHEKREYKLQTH